MNRLASFQRFCSTLAPNLAWRIIGRGPHVKQNWRHALVQGPDGGLKVNGDLQIDLLTSETCSDIQQRTEILNMIAGASIGTTPSLSRR